MELVAVQGYLEEGIFHPDQPLPPGKVPAVLTFVATPAAKAVSKPRPRFSFDEALAMTVDTSAVQVADEVTAEREEGD